jgi:hypothetical protein
MQEKEFDLGRLKPCFTVSFTLLPAPPFFGQDRQSIAKKVLWRNKKGDLRTLVALLFLPSKGAHDDVPYCCFSPFFPIGT